MIASNHSKPKRERADAKPSNRTPDLPFRIELWDDQRRGVERIVARVHSANLAQAIFKAACAEFPGRHLTLWRGHEQLAAKED